MRLRKKPGTKEKLASIPFVLEWPDRCKGTWRNVFSQKMGEIALSSPLHVELGTGKGDFILGKALQNPDVCFVGCEVQAEVLLIAVDKIAKAELKNVLFIWNDVQFLENFFAPSEVDRIYLNFSDPWPKSRHAKRRLTSGKFLQSYQQVLKPGGEIYYKTDNRPFFEYSVEEFTAHGFILRNLTRDLHAGTVPAGDVMTEYEKRFSSMGVPINRLEALWQGSFDESTNK